MMEVTTPILVQHVHDGTDEGFEQRWHCPFPGERVAYQVIRATWSADYRVRDIYEIETR